MNRVQRRRKLRAEITRLKAQIRRDEQAITQVERHAPDNPLFVNTSREALLTLMYARQRRNQERLVLIEIDLAALDPEQGQATD